MVKKTSKTLFKLQDFSLWKDPDSKGCGVATGFLRLRDLVAMPRLPLATDNLRNPRDGLHKSPIIRKGVEETASTPSSKAPFVALSGGLEIAVTGCPTPAKNGEVAADVLCLYNGATTCTTLYGMPPDEIHPSQWIFVRLVFGYSDEALTATIKARNKGKPLGFDTTVYLDGGYEWLRQLLNGKSDSVNFHEGSTVDVSDDPSMPASIVSQILVMSHPQLLTRDATDESIKRTYSGKAFAQTMVDSHPEYMAQYTEEATNFLLDLHDGVHLLFQQGANAKEQATYLKGKRKKPLPFSKKEALVLGKGYLFPVLYALSDQALCVKGGKIEVKHDLETVLKHLKTKKAALTKLFAKHDNDAFGKDLAKWALVKNTIGVI